MYICIDVFDLVSKRGAHHCPNVDLSAYQDHASKLAGPIEKQTLIQIQIRILRNVCVNDNSWRSIFAAAQERAKRSFSTTVCPCRSTLISRRQFDATRTY